MRITSKNFDNEVRKSTLNQRINAKGNAENILDYYGHTKAWTNDKGSRVCFSHPDAYLLDNLYNERYSEALYDRYNQVNTKRQSRERNTLEEAKRMAVRSAKIKKASETDS